MPNWTSTTYVFRSKEKEPIEAFRNNLLSWTKSKSLLESAWDGSPYWLGNILLNAGFKYDEKEHDFNCCRCRGTLEDISELVEKTNSRDDHFFCFYITTETAWRTMPKMWQLIIEKLYPGKIEFGFFAIDECNECIEVYKPEILEFIGIDPNDKYWFDSYIDGNRYSQFESIQNYYGEMSAEEIAGALSVILEKEVTEEEVQNAKQLEEIVDAANKLLNNFDEDFYVHISEISLVSPSDFE